MRNINWAKGVFFGGLIAWLILFSGVNLFGIEFQFSGLLGGALIYIALFSSIIMALGSGKRTEP